MTITIGTAIAQDHAKRLALAALHVVRSIQCDQFSQHLLHTWYDPERSLRALVGRRMLTGPIAKGFPSKATLTMNPSQYK